MNCCHEDRYRIQISERLRRVTTLPLPCADTEYLGLEKAVAAGSRERFPRPLRCRNCGGADVALGHVEGPGLENPVLCCDRCLHPLAPALINYADDYDDLGFAGLA